MPAPSHSRKDLANRKTLSPSACIPSLRPVLLFSLEKLKVLYKRKSAHKRGSELLMDMLPAQRAASSSTIPISNDLNSTYTQHSILGSSAIIEVEGNSRRVPELDAEAPGPHVLEIETVEPISEMDPQNPTKHHAELDAEAPGPHILEIGTEERRLEGRYPRPIADFGMRATIPRNQK